MPGVYVDVAAMCRRGSGGEGSGRADLGGPILDGALFSVPMAAGRGPNQQQEDLSLLGVDPLLLAGAVPEPASMDLGYASPASRPRSPRTE